jgi:hypothetical protein
MIKIRTRHWFGATRKSRRARVLMEAGKWLIEPGEAVPNVSAIKTEYPYIPAPSSDRHKRIRKWQQKRAARRNGQV